MKYGPGIRTLLLILFIVFPRFGNLFRSKAEGVAPRRARYSAILEWCDANYIERQVRDADKAAMQYSQYIKLQRHSRHFQLDTSIQSTAAALFP